MARVHLQLLLLVVACVVAVDRCDSATTSRLNGRLIRQKRLSCADDKYPWKSICCKKCEAGKFVKKHCNISLDTECNDCTNGFYSDEPSANTDCKPCRTCDPAHKLHTSRRCSAVLNAICECDDDFYCSHTDGIGNCMDCSPLTACPPGSGITKPVSLWEDVHCSECGDDAYSPGGIVFCKRYTNCSSLRTVTPVEKTKDVKCVDAQLSPSMVTLCVIVGIVFIIVVIICGVMYRRRRPGICKTKESSEEEKLMTNNVPAQQKNNDSKPSDGAIEIVQATNACNGSVSKEDAQLSQRESPVERVAGADGTDAANTAGGRAEDVSPPSSVPKQSALDSNPAVREVLQCNFNVHPAVTINITAVGIPGLALQPGQPPPPTPPPDNQARPDTKPLPETQPHSGPEPCTVQPTGRRGPLPVQLSCDGATADQNDLAESLPCPVLEGQTLDRTYSKPVQEEGEVDSGKDSSFREPVEESTVPGDCVV